MKRRGVVLVAFVVFAALMGAALAHVYVRLKVIRLSYDIGERTKVRRELEEEHRRLQVERSLLRSPDRIERLARDKLGMRRPDAAQIRVARPPDRELAAAMSPAAMSPAGGPAGGPAREPPAPHGGAGAAPR